MARVCIHVWFLKIHAPHQSPQGMCTNINLEDESLFHDENVNLFLPLGRVKYQEPKIIRQEQAGDGQSQTWGETLSVWLRLLLAHSFIVLQSELISFSVRWVKVKLHGLRKEHNSSMSKAGLSMFKKNVKSGHWVPEESLVDKHSDWFAHYFTPFAALKITAGFRLHLIWIFNIVGKFVIRLGWSKFLKIKCLPSNILV